MECSFRVARSCGFHAETQRERIQRMLGKDLETERGGQRVFWGPRKRGGRFSRVTTLKSSDASGEGEAVTGR